MTPQQHLDGIRTQILRWHYSADDADRFIRFYGKMKENFFSPARFHAFVAFYKSEIAGSGDAAIRASNEAILTSSIVKCLRSHIRYDEKVALLADVPITSSGNCLALSCVFFAVGRNLGLRVVPVSTIHEGVDHRCLLVQLSDGMSIGVDLATAKGSAGREFKLSEAYEEVSRGHHVSKPSQAELFHTDIQLGGDDDLLASILETRAAKYLRANNVEAAISQFSKAIRISTNDFDRARLYQNRAFAHGDAGNRQLQMDDLCNSINCGRIHKEVFADRALAYGLVRDNDHALSDIDAALRIDPSFARAYRIKAGVLKAMGDHAGAVDAFNTAKQLDPAAMASVLQRPRRDAR